MLKVLLLLAVIASAYGRDSVTTTVIGSKDSVYTKWLGATVTVNHVYVTRTVKVTHAYTGPIGDSAVVVPPYYTNYYAKSSEKWLQGPDNICTVSVVHNMKPRVWIKKDKPLLCTLTVKYKKNISVMYGNGERAYFDVDSMTSDTSRAGYWDRGVWHDHLNWIYIDRNSYREKFFFDSFTVFINPFKNVSTETIPVKAITSNTELKMFDALGRPVKGMKPRGVYFVWDGSKCVRRVNLR